MDESIKENLPCFSFPTVFEASLPSEYEPVTPTPAERERIMKNILCFRSSNMEYMRSESMEFYCHGTLRELRRYGDGTFSARVETWTYTEYHLRDAPYHIVMRLDRDLSLIEYTLYENRQDDNDLMYVFQKNQGNRAVPRESAGDVVDWISRLHAGAGLSVGNCNNHRLALRFMRMYGDCFKVSLAYPHPPWSFTASDIRKELIAEIVSALARDGFEAAVGRVDWRFDARLPPKGEVRLLGIKIRLLHHKYRAMLEGDVGKVKQIDSLKLESGYQQPLWVRLHQADWPTMMEELVDIADSGKGDATSRKLMLLYAAYEGSERACKMVSERSFA